MCFFKKLPYPEEKQDKTKTLANTKVSDVLDLLFGGEGKIPLEYKDYWLDWLVIRLFSKWTPEILSYWPNVKESTPAFTYEDNGKDYIYCLVPWYNCGIVKHELGHGAEKLLSAQEWVEFINTYDRLIKTDKMLQYLNKVQPIYNDFYHEVYADIYRFLTEQMPPELRRFYPKLFI